ncbi:diaminopimelate decarboxylase [Gallaecimonas xiamenensis]|uniref:Diaminopimelate decarboxylase n=1 Tax=Gallaecimonas xiamenensis 3-C-1 TaxID=745411 RepID=K2JN28_9GAMM|nr:diaminopimelate decarboxylase [Gallaecimonas xiamenensis]EKE75887.1 diaminopimelate decarboxylase [Gallaecimonas xiamenensis 3-C-1]
MSHHYQNQQLMLEDAAVADLADQFGTPLYLYSRAAIEQAYQAFASPLKGRKHLICFAVKANSNLAVLNLLARLGAGFDIVSGGELARVLAAGGDPAKVVFSGVGKTRSEMAQALKAGIHCFNVESVAELDRLNGVAGELGLVAPISIRVNPDVDAKTHPYIATGLKENKFGIDILMAPDAFRKAASLPNLKVLGVDCHIGSQLTETEPFVAALKRLLALREQLQADGIELAHIDIGGGLGVTYTDEQPPKPADYLAEILPLIPAGLTLVLEPGRALVANAGLLVGRVEMTKDNGFKRFVILDTGMNDLMRPTLYQAVMPVLPINQAQQNGPLSDLVGPVCETGDWLAKDVPLGAEEGDLVAIGGAGAYGFVMSSQYNSRPRAAEVMVQGSQAVLIRQRETVESLWAGEQLLPEASC